MNFLMIIHYCHLWVAIYWCNMCYYSIYLYITHSAFFHSYFCHTVRTFKTSNPNKISIDFLFLINITLILLLNDKKCKCYVGRTKQDKNKTVCTVQPIVVLYRSFVHEYNYTLELWITVPNNRSSQCRVHGGEKPHKNVELVLKRPGLV